MINGLSKDDILTKYENLDVLFKEAIEIVYGKEQSKLITIYKMDNIEEDIIKSHCGKKEDKYKAICKLKDRTGVYVFRKDNEIMYIGVGGTGKEWGLIGRIKAEVREYSNKNSNATLSKNIQDIDCLLENIKISSNDSKEKIKTFSLLVLDLGDITEDNQNNSKALEMVLISLLRPKYNR